MTRFNQALPCLLVLLAGCATAPNPRMEDNTQQKAQLRHVLDEIVDACEKKDLDRLDRQHLYGASFTKFDSASPTRWDASAARQGEHRGLSAANDLHMRMDDLNIQVFGHTGICTFILAYSFKSGAETVQKQTRATLVFVRDHGAWKIVHEHLSSIAPVP